MPMFTIDIERITKISVDVEADSVEDAVSKVYEVMTVDDYHDSDDQIEFVHDEDGNNYYKRLTGEWIRDDSRRRLVR